MDANPWHMGLCKVMDQCIELFDASEMLPFSEELEGGGGRGTGKTLSDPSSCICPVWESLKIRVL